jgi:glyoxylase-like metal-dependent hydrolase (beta-lactamase superfamily II)
MLSLPRADELAPGLFYWTAHHEEWGKDVGSVALSGKDGVVLIDPLAPHGVREARRFWKALDAGVEGRRLDVVVTLHYHRRSAASVTGRYDHATLWAPEGSVGRLGVAVDRPFAPGDVLPAAIAAYATGRPDEVVLWLPEQRALVSGDVLLGGTRRAYRVCPSGWLPRGVTRHLVATTLEPLRQLPVALLVPTHGPPVLADARAVLATAIDDALRS